jgi:hypothetical protein
VRSFGATGSILDKRQKAENRFAPHLYSTTVVHKFRESRQSSELRSSRALWKNKLHAQRGKFVSTK